MNTVNKTLDILDIFLNRSNAISVAELVNSTGINISAVYRILTNLTERGYVTKQKRGR